MRLVMLGTGPFAVPTLRALAAEHDVRLVVSRPFKGRKSTPRPPMHTTAEELGIELWTPASVNLPESVERLAALEADLLVVCDYGEILKPAVLAATRLGGVNLHGSLLPKYRGAAPVQWAVINGEQVTGNTVIQMTAGLDSGPCLAQQQLAIEPEETAGQLEARLAALGADAVAQVVDALATGTAKAIEQDPAEASKAPRLKKQHGLVDWSAPAEAISNRIRGLHPWPRAFSFWQVHQREPLRVVIERARVADDIPWNGELPPGQVLNRTDRLVVATGRGWLELLELQPAGRRTMAGADFLRGHAGGRFVPPPTA